MKNNFIEALENLEAEGKLNFSSRYLLKNKDRYPKSIEAGNKWMGEQESLKEAIYIIGLSSLTSEGGETGALHDWIADEERERFTKEVLEEKAYVCMKCKKEYTIREAAKVNYICDCTLPVSFKEYKNKYQGIDEKKLNDMYEDYLIDFEYEELIPLKAVNKYKEKEIIDILNEMKDDRLKKLGFTDLLIEICIKNKHGEKFERYGSSDGFKTIMEDVIEKTSFSTHKSRLNNVSLEDSYIENGVLVVFYEENKKTTFDLDTITKVFIMKQNDNKVY